MENASKALIIAGGVLLAIIILSVVIYMSTSLTRIADQQDKNTLAKQITAFNKEYEAYNKKRMYGTDIITIVNKAIEHNQNIEVIEDDPYYINIILNNLSSEWVTTVKKIDINSPENTEVDVDADDWTFLIAQGVNVNNVELLQNSTLVTFSGDGRVILNKNMKEYFSQNATDPEPKYSADGRYKYIIKSALTNFKRATFECTDVQYNQETGRISSMTFRQR